MAKAKRRKKSTRYATYRSAVTGLFVNAAFAAKHPREVMREWRRR